MAASASFSDVGIDDTHSCTVDYGDGPVAGTVDQDLNTCTGPSHTYFDNTSYAVTIEVTDDDTGSGDNTDNHMVSNVDPTVAIDLTGAIDFPGECNAFFGIVGVEQDHDADGHDVGTDDLDFLWSFPPQVGSDGELYFNNGVSADLQNSSAGVHPFDPSDNQTVTFAEPGLYTVRVDLTDDDNGTDYDEALKIVVDDTQCTRTQGFWGHQFKGKGKQHIDNTTLQNYLDVIDCTSSVFSEIEAAAIPSEAKDRFAPGGDKRHKATRQTLAAWLNFAAGAVAWDEPIDLDGDLVPDTTFGELIAAVEAILNDPVASDEDLVLAKSLSEVVNLLDEEAEGCDD
jgi:PKD repeat protein